MLQPSWSCLITTPMNTLTVAGLDMRSRVHIAQHLIGGQRAGLNDLIVDRHARRLARVIVDDSLAANAIGAQTLEDRVLGEYLGDPFGLLRVDCRLPAVQGITYGVSVRHFDHRPRARSRP
jgi:hypothetical protein